jgi:small subunit ribosomal protein S17
MAEETPEPEITPDAPSEGEVAPDASAAQDASADQAQPDANAPDADPVSDETAEPAAAAPSAEAAETLAPKERRRRQRAAKAAEVPTRPATSPEERQGEREAERRRKAEIRRKGRTRSREKATARRAQSPAAEPLAPRREQHPGQQKTRQGVVVSDRASKTIVVRIDVARRHRSYGKVVRTSTTLHAHDEREDAHIGDTVVVREARPLSRTKRWRLVEVLERAK